MKQLSLTSLVGHLKTNSFVVVSLCFFFSSFNQVYGAQDVTTSSSNTVTAAPRQPVGSSSFTDGSIVFHLAPGEQLTSKCPHTAIKIRPKSG